MEAFKTLTAEVTVKGTPEQIWKLWTTPADIMQWNNVDDDWLTTHVESDLKDGGSFLFKMRKKDGSSGFDFAGKYNQVVPYSKIESTTSDNRKTINTFIVNKDEIAITEIFEPEKETPLEIQKQFCQSVLNQFKAYAESKKIP